MRHDPRRSTVLRMIGLAAVVAMAATGCLRADVTTLAGDAFGGRQTGTAGGDQARTWVANRLASIAQPIRPASIVAARTGPSSLTSETLTTEPSVASRCRACS